MDPLSITTGIITCVGAAVATAKAIEQTKQLVKLPKEFNALFEEVADLQTTLEQCSSIELVRARGELKEWCTTEDSSNLVDLRRHVQRAQVKLEELEALVKDRRGSMGIRSPEQLKTTWFNVVKGKSRLDSLKDELREIRMNLFTALNVFTATAVKHIQVTVEGIATGTAKIASGQQQLLETVLAWHQATAVPRPITPQPQFLLPSYEETQASANSRSSPEHGHTMSALAYLESFKFRYSGDEAVGEKFDVIKSEFKNEQIDEHAVSERISVLFSRYPDLIKAFNSFLAPRDRVEGPDQPTSLNFGARQSHSSISFTTVPPGSRRRSSETLETRLAKSRALFKASYTDTGQCVPWCSCRCHVPMSIYSPRALKEVVGTLNVTHGGMPYITRSCDQKQCLRRAQPYFRVSYKPPRALASTMVAMTMSMEELAGPEFRVKLPRVVGWNSPLWLYAREGNTDAVFNLCKAGLASPWDVNSFGSNMLAYATQTWNPEMARRLIKFGVDPSIEDDFRCSAAMYAWDRVLTGKLSGEDAEIVSTLFGDVDYISSCHFTSLHKIIFGMSDKTLEAELECSTAEVDTPDSYGRTPVSWASARGDDDAIRLLIEAGADVNITDWRVETPLHYARNEKVAKLLVEAGADLYAQNMDGQTPLYRIAKKNTNAALVQYLVQCGCGVNTQDKALQTPLDGACSTTWFLPVVNVLLDNGADINIKNDSDDTSLRFAIIYNSHDILRRMLEPQFRADFSGINNYGQGFAHAIARTADIETIEILTEARPLSLTLDLRRRDASNKTCMDYLEERLEYLSETQELRESWLKLAAALERNSLPFNEGKIEEMAEKLDVSMRVTELDDDDDEEEDVFDDAHEEAHSPI